MSAAQQPLPACAQDDDVREHVALWRDLASGERMPLHVAEGLAALLDAVRNAVVCTEMGDAYADAERVPVWWRDVMAAYRLQVPRQRTEGDDRRGAAVSAPASWCLFERRDDDGDRLVVEAAGDYLFVIEDRRGERAVRVQLDRQPALQLVSALGADLAAAHDHDDGGVFGWELATIGTLEVEVTSQLGATAKLGGRLVGGPGLASRLRGDALRLLAAAAHVEAEGTAAAGGGSR